jgi:Cholesterol oxidase, substrate-binding/FAD binding domain
MTGVAADKLSGVAPGGFPDGIPIARGTFENWCQMIDVPNVWTCVPNTEDDVVTVCNWARQAGFTVRARGMMHTWSPLTVTQGESTTNLLLVDTTQHLTTISVQPAGGGQPARAVVQTGATMEALMTALEGAAGGGGAAAGFSFAHIPAPGNLTVGGALAINAHGTAVPTGSNDDFATPYGSLSNQILAFTAVVTSPGSDVYTSKTFTRDDPDAKAFLTHCGRAFLLNVTLQIVDNYNLRCQSFMNILDTTLFAQPSGGVAPAGSLGDYLDQSGRVEVIWFPPLPILGFTPPSYPWLKVWTVEAQKPAASTAVTEPYNYGFSDNLPLEVTSMLKSIVSGAAWLTPAFSAAFATFTSNALEGGLGFSNATDLWGPSKNTLLYVQDATLRVTANGYAVLMKRAQVQQAVADVTTQFTTMLDSYQDDGLYPINSPMEIRVTALDDPSKIVAPSAQSPVISSLSVDPVVEQAGWDVACWFDVLTVIPDGDPQQAYRFYADFEAWLKSHFGTGFRVCPEWSKGWAYTNSGAWNDSMFGEIRNLFTNGRAADDTWAWEVETLARYDSAGLFTNPLLETLFTT